jgi:predicted Zn-dependent protease
MRNILVAIVFAMSAAPAAAADSVATAVDRLESGWAQANYQTTDKAAQIAALDRLIASATVLEQQAPRRAEPLIWHGVLMTTKAGVVGGFAGFKLVSEARKTLEQAETIAPGAAGGLGLVQLGVLYYQVPGAPIAFGNRAKAKSYLQRALAIDPQSLAANLAYADFLVEGGRFAEAEPVLLRALQAQPGNGHPVAAQGRRGEVTTLLKKVRTRLGRNG